MPKVQWETRERVTPHVTVMIRSVHKSPQQHSISILNRIKANFTQTKLLSPVRDGTIATPIQSPSSASTSDYIYAPPTYNSQDLCQEARRLDRVTDRISLRGSTSSNLHIKDKKCHDNGSFQKMTLLVPRATKREAFRENTYVTLMVDSCSRHSSRIESLIKKPDIEPEPAMRSSSEESTIIPGMVVFWASNGKKIIKYKPTDSPIEPPVTSTHNSYAQIRYKIPKPDVQKLSAKSSSSNDYPMPPLVPSKKSNVPKSV